MIRKKRILVSPLNWGLGHATRCIPIIRTLLQLDVEVILAAEGRPKALLQEEFPDLEIISLPGYSITYPEDDKMTKHMLKSLPVIFGGIIKEHQALNKVIEQLSIDAIISDNRYGLYTRKAKTAFITHQLSIQAPAFKKIVNVLSHWFIKRFDSCWIPDYPDSLLGMELSSASMDLIHHKYIGPLSRFSTPVDQIENNDILAIISGPEPQRSIFEEKVLRDLKRLNKKAIVVLGKTEERSYQQDGKIEIYSHLVADELEKVFNASKLIIARSGYSTLMDIERLNKKAILIPTPGQPEQEYLAEQLANKNMFYTMHQDAFDLEKAFSEVESNSFTGYNTSKKNAEELLEKAIRNFIDSIDS